MDVFMGFISPFGFNFPPRGWSTCQGQLLSIAQNTALFSLLGTTFGGNGQTTFGLPDLQGRMPIGMGTGPGLPTYVIGEVAGQVSVILTPPQTPLATHTHTASMSMTGLNATTNISVSTGTTGGALVAETNSTLTSTATGSSAAAGIYLPAATAPTNPVNLGGVSTTVSGSGTVTVDPSGTSAAVPVPLMNPYLALNFCIALQGIFPSRN